MPTTAELKREIWQLCYPGETFDDSSSIGDLYGAAVRQKGSELSYLLQSRLMVDPDTLPDYYHAIFNFPWFRCYTLNVDDLESAAGRRFTFERSLLTVSARDRESARLSGSLYGRGLEVVHLNGVLPAPPEDLTFSETQYAERIANQEPWYSRCVVEITSRPVVFIGTVLSESLLWQHMYLRKRRENLGRDLRPTSILVTRDLPLPRRDILRDLRINWVQGTAEEFANEILPELETEANRGFAFIRQHSEGQSSGYVPLVSQLISERPRMQTEYLLGDEPQWSDILDGRAIERAHDETLLHVAEEVLDRRKLGTALAVTGTAGTGKSTALMSLAVKLSGGGVPVLWVDKDSDAAPLRIRSRVREFRDKVALLIDDADMYGRELAGMLRDLVPNTSNFLFVFAVRSGKLDQIIAAVRPDGDLHVHEHVVPPLTDDDIDGLIAVLEKNSRLGLLTGASAAVRREAFRDQAGRQLLVAMIQATSNESFEKKAREEYTELEATHKYAYALVAVATSLRFALTKDEVLLAQGDSHEEALAALERLTARHFILFNPAKSDYRCRHRVIADLVFDKVKELSELGEVLVGLAWALATKSPGPGLDRHSRNGRFLIRVINHDFLLQTIGFMAARDMYTRLEGLLSVDYHYWLQRGSLEVEAGDIRRAENFLGAARSLGAGDFRVDTAYAYMLMRKAWETPRDLHAEEYLNSGIKELENVIESSGSISDYPYHVLGSQALAWVHRTIWNNKEAKRLFLTKVANTVEMGLKFHQASEMLRSLRDALKKEILLTVVSEAQSTTVNRVEAQG